LIYDGAAREEKFMIDNNTKGLIRSLIYPVQFEKDPNNGIERVVEFIIEDVALGVGVSREKYIAAIKSALNSTEELSTLIPQPHSDLVIREFLRELERTLAHNDRKRVP
jgi:hypothetical protein